MSLKFSILNQLSPKGIDRLWPEGPFYGNELWQRHDDLSPISYRLSAERHIGSPLGAKKKMCTFFDDWKFCDLFFEKVQTTQKANILKSWGSCQTCISERLTKFFFDKNKRVG